MVRTKLSRFGVIWAQVKRASIYDKHRLMVNQHGLWPSRDGSHDNRTVIII